MYETNELPEDEVMEAFNNDPTLGGTVRALSAAVMRLADENLALSEMVTDLSKKLEEVTGLLPATVEIEGPDGEITAVTVGIEEFTGDDGLEGGEPEGGDAATEWRPEIKW